MLSAAVFASYCHQPRQLGSVLLKEKEFLYRLVASLYLNVKLKFQLLKTVVLQQA